MGRRKRRTKVTVQGVNNPVPAASVGVTTSHVSSRSNDCDPAVLGVDALAPTAVPATSASVSNPKVDDSVFRKDHDLTRAGESQSKADRTASVGGDDPRTYLKKTIDDSLERQSRELLDQLERLVPEETTEDMLPEELLHNLTLTDDELDTTVIPAKSTRVDRCSPDEGGMSLVTQPEASRIPTGPVSAHADKKLERQEATEMMSDDGESVDDPKADSCSKFASARKASDARHYKRAVSYLRRFVGKDANLHSEREVHLIKGKLKFMRKFERMYPREFHREFPVERIFLPEDVVEKAKPATSSKCAAPKSSSSKPIPNREVKKKAIESTPKPTVTPSGDRAVKDSASKPDSAPKGKGDAIEDAGLNRERAGSAKEISSSGGENSASQSKSVKRVRSSEGPQPSAKKTMTSQLIEPSTSYAAAAGRVTKEKQLSTEKVSASSGKVKSKVRGQRRNKPYGRPTAVTDDGLQIAIIDRADPNGKISDSHWLLFETGLRAAIVSGPEDPEDRQLGSAFLRKGVKVINCMNERSRDFLVQTVSGLGALWEGADLAAVSLSDIPSRKVLSAWIPPPTVSKEILLRMLRLQNPNLVTTGWTVISLVPCSELGGLVARVAVDPPGELYLREREGKLNFGSGWVRFRLSPPREKQ
ncbi:uncharacterized protein [Musca autumnalis]|uniref:uncharacterized protein n=1 Tax=Musca autumnalis TaxID=221902 RepID=UPI003CED6907